MTGDRPAVARHRITGTRYVEVDWATEETGYVRVTTAAGAKFIVRAAKLIRLEPPSRPSVVRVEDTTDYQRTCEHGQCDQPTIALVIDMENNWRSLCGQHAVDDLTSTRERGA